MYPIFTCATAGHVELAANLQASAHRLGFEVEVEDLPSTDALYGTPGFSALAVDKLQLLIDCLQRHRSFIYVDADCSFLRPPHIERVSPLHAQTDCNGLLCSGVMLCTPACEWLFKNALAWLVIHNDSEPTYADDQIAIQRAVKAYDFPWAPLPVESWPDGSSPWFPDATLVHANWVIGVEAKKQRLIDAGAWFV